MITGIGHSAYRVKDIDASAQLLCQAGHRRGVRHCSALTDRSGSCLLMGGGQFVELFPNGTEQVSVGQQTIGLRPPLPRSGRHGKTVADIESKGVVLDRPIRLGGDGIHQAWVVDSDGNRFGRLQIPPDSRQAKARRRQPRRANGGPEAHGARKMCRMCIKAKT